MSMRGRSYLIRILPASLILSGLLMGLTASPRTASPGCLHGLRIKPSESLRLGSYVRPAFGGSYKIARLKYNGGGDWYGDRTALKNLAEFCNKELKTNFDPTEAVVEPQSPEIFNYPFVFVTGHGNISFSDQEASNLRKYLLGGGFLHICDNYGFDKFIRAQMKKVFPGLNFVEIPYSHPVFHQKYAFPSGVPKIHEHDGKRAQAFGLFYEGRLLCFYDFEADLGNGWEDLGTYPDDPPLKHQQALQMGANLISYAFKQ